MASKHCLCTVFAYSKPSAKHNRATIFGKIFDLFPRWRDLVSARPAPVVYPSSFACGRAKLTVTGLRRPTRSILHFLCLAHGSASRIP